MLKILGCALASGALTVGAARAEEWVYAGRDSDTAFAYAAESVTRSGAMVTLRILDVPTETVEDGRQSFDYSVETRTIDCDRQRSKINSSVFYSFRRSGPVYTETDYRDVEIRFTRDNHLFRAACSNTARTGEVATANAFARQLRSRLLEPRTDSWSAPIKIQDWWVRRELSGGCKITSGFGDAVVVMRLSAKGRESLFIQDPRHSALATARLSGVVLLGDSGQEGQDYSVIFEGDVLLNALVGMQGLGPIGIDGLLEAVAGAHVLALASEALPEGYAAYAVGPMDEAVASLRGCVLNYAG